MNTDERFHAYCQNVDTINSVIRSDKQRLMQKSESSQMIMDDDYSANTHYYIQNELNDEIKSINLSTWYWYDKVILTKLLEFDIEELRYKEADILYKKFDELHDIYIDFGRSQNFSKKLLIDNIIIINDIDNHKSYIFSSSMSI